MLPIYGILRSKPRASEASAKDPAEDKDQQANTQVLLQQLNSANTTIDDLRVRLSESEKRSGNLAKEKADLEKQVLLKRSVSPPKGGNPSKKSKGASDVSMMVAEITIENNSGTELALLKSQLELKSQLLVKCRGALIDLKSQTRVLVAELESTRGILKQFTRQTSFAINKRFTSTFTKLLTIGVQKSNLRSASKERAVTERDGGSSQAQKTGRQLRPQRSLELNASFQGNQSYDDSVWNEPEFIREKTFETLLAYVERIEREEGNPGFYSNNLILHNVNRDWDKPYGVLISNSAQATPLTGSNEKVPPGPEIMAHTARKLASEKSISGRSGSRSPNNLKKEPLPEISEKKSSKSGQKPLDNVRMGKGNEYQFRRANFSKPREKPKGSVLEDEPSTPFPKKGYSPKRTGSKTNGNHPETAAGQSTARFGGEKPVTFGKERRVSTEKPAMPREPASEEFTLQGKQHKRDSVTPRDGSRKDRSNTRREFRNLQKELEQAREPDTTTAKKIKKEVIGNVKRESNTTQQQEPPLKAVVARLRSSIDQDRKTLGFERELGRGRARSKSPTTKHQPTTPEKGTRRAKQEPSPSEDRSVTKRLRSREHSHGRNSQSNR